MVRWNDPDPPAGYERFQMLDAEANPEWAAYQAKVAAWEKSLKDKRLI